MSIGDLPYKAAWSTYHWRREAWKSEPCHCLHSWRSFTNNWYESSNELYMLLWSCYLLFKDSMFMYVSWYQDNYLEEAYKMRNVLQEFVRRPRDQSPTILGLREHIFTGRSVILQHTSLRHVLSRGIIMILLFVQCFISCWLHVISRDKLCYNWTKISCWTP